MCGDVGEKYVACVPKKRRGVGRVGAVCTYATKVAYR